MNFVQKILLKYGQKGLQYLADSNIPQLIKTGILRQASDLEKISPEDLLAIKAFRDKQILEAKATKNLNIKKTQPEPEVDIFEEDVVQAGPSEETLNNPFFGSFYTHTDKAKKSALGKSAVGYDRGLIEAKYAISGARNNYVKNKLNLIQKENPNAIPKDMANFRNFMIALEKEASELIDLHNLDELPKITSSIPNFKNVVKGKKQSLSEFTGTSFQEDYKNRIYSIWQDKIPDIRAGHELMITRRKEIGDERFLNQVKYPVFFTNSTRNSAHIRLENALVSLRDEKLKITSSSTPSEIRNSNRIPEIDRIIKNIKHDMTELGLETRLYDFKTKKFRKYGKAYTSPAQLYNSIQKKQKLKYIGSSDDMSQKKPSYVSFEEDGVFLPEGYKQGGFASIEEVLEY